MRLVLLSCFAIVTLLGAGCTTPSHLSAIAHSPEPQPSPLAPLSTLPVTCAQNDDLFYCRDSFLRLDFSYPAFLGEIISVDLRPGGYAGLAYDYTFAHDEGLPVAGGRSADFSEGRERTFTDQSAFPAGSSDAICQSWGADICKPVAPGIVLLAVLPDLTPICEGKMFPPSPFVMVAVNLPDHPAIHGFSFVDWLLPRDANAVVEEKLRAALIGQSACDEEDRAAFAAQMASFRDDLLLGTADATSQARFDAFWALARSISGSYVSDNAHFTGEEVYDLPVVDAVTAAVRAGNRARLAELIHYSTFQCGAVAALGGPPACREGEPAGTTVEGLPLLDAEGVIARPDEQEGWIRTFLAGNPVLVGVYAQPGGLPSDVGWLPATHALLFVGSEGPTIATVLSVDDEGIVSVYSDAAPAALLARITGDLVESSLIPPCAVTPPNGATPPGEQPSANFLGNGNLWTALWPDGAVLITDHTQVRDDGSLTMKWPWWHSVPGRLSISGHRLDAEAPPLEADIPEGYGETGFQATGLIFSTPGCWEVTGRVGDATLTFVTRVIDARRDSGKP